MLFSFKSTMQRKDSNVADRGFHHKWLDILVYEVRGNHKTKVFDCEFDLAYAMPPRNDTSPHILLDKDSGASISFSIGYKRMDNGPKPSFFSCASYATPAPTNDIRGMAPEAGMEPKRRTRSSNWWSCGAQSAEPPMGRCTSQPKQRKVQFNDEPEEWDRSIKSLGCSFKSLKEVDDKDHNDKDAPQQEAQQPVRSASPQPQARHSVGGGGAPTGVEELMREARQQKLSEEQEQRQSVGDAAGGGDDLYSYPVAPPSSREAREKGIIRAGMSAPLSARSGSNSARQRMARPDAMNRPDNKDLFTTQQLQNEAAFEQADKTIYLHEIDVKVLTRTSKNDDPAINKAREMCNVTEGSFSPVSTIERNPDLTTTAEVGEVTIPRIWALVWSNKSDFMKELHAQYKSKKYVPGTWDIAEDEGLMKWCGSRICTFTKGGKVFGKIEVVQKSYFVAYKYKDSPSVLLVHTSQRSKDPEHTFRVETVYKFRLEGGVMYAIIDSKLVEDKGAVPLPKGVKQKLGKQAKHWHESFNSKVVGRAQAHLLRRALGPGLYMTAKSSKKGSKASKHALSASVKKKAQQRLTKYGASMGTLARFPSMRKLGATNMGASGIKVRNLNSFLMSSKGADDSVKLTRNGRVDKIPFWKTLTDTNTLINPNQCQYSLTKLYDNLLLYPMAVLEKEGFTENQVLVLTKIIAAYPKQSAGSEVKVLETVFKILKLISSVSLPVMISTPNAVNTIIAAWKCSRQALREHTVLVEMLEAHSARGKQTSSKRATGASKKLMQFFDCADQVLERYHCSVILPSGEKHGGTLYVTRTWLCFLSKTTRMMIATYDITDVKGSDTLMGTKLIILAENKCTDPLDFSDPHAQSLRFEFTIWFQKNVDKQIRALVDGGRRFRVSYYHIP
eukprot:TRINITY_DN10349_c1_g1_i2.p1 TRINITY_DN10349_c1_g1~~TRINITY_DN10349_c1_g1_i2.p1  ORF type:complete len:899 (+),score=296.71 TRINITY_DN10349_c1_g1_i2:190-2886(+)